MDLDIPAAHILLVEDNPGDIRLMREALRSSEPHQKSLSVVDNGEDALAYLNQTGKYATASRPDLIFLDLNLPKKGGREVLAEIKQNVALRRIPVIVLTTSEADRDVEDAYNLYANCYVKKPADLDHYLAVIRQCEMFWLTMVRLPAK